MESVKLTLYGDVKIREQKEDINATSSEHISPDTLTSIDTKSITYQVTVSDPMQLHKLLCKKSATAIAEYCLPENYFVESRRDSFDLSMHMNAKEVKQTAIEVEKQSDLGIVNILSLWLQTTGSMRVRRALHIELQSKGLDVDYIE